MKTLGSVLPTPEQLTVIEDPSPGYWLIRGAAGSGKTTTALLRLRFLVSYWRQRRADLGLDAPVRILVLTFNRTLRGYIDELTRRQVADGPDVLLDVTTFSSWAQRALDRVVLDYATQAAEITALGAGRFPWSQRFLVGEVQYALGRFLPEDLPDYLEARRLGRGAAPRVDRAARRRLFEEVILPYQQWKREQGVIDWEDLAAEMAQAPPKMRYDVVVVDEAQDFSANQVRAVVHHLADPFVCTFIRDSTQRIYPNVFSWQDVGITYPAQQNKRLGVNYRNTRQIAEFARPLVENIEATEDSHIPDFRGCVREGPMPVVLRGRYFDQLDWTIEYLRSGQIGSDETVAFLHPLGWFRDLRPRLTLEEIPWTSLTREAEWPDGPEQVALSTMHSAKGLEFDHVILIGYNAEVTPHGEEAGDSLLDTHRRLLAMAVGRARKSVTLGYKPSEASTLIRFLDERTYRAVDL
jgi:superfamily I DNA/RNA helicase